MKTYWHFCRNDKKLDFRDGRKIRKGRTLKVKGEPVLCEHGLHASKRALDALKYARGDVACKVTLSGKVIDDTNKSVAQERTVIAWANAERVLHEFACLCAERALRKAKVTDPRCWRAIEAKRDWLAGKITDEELVKAWAAARTAAWEAEAEAARTAAWAEAARAAGARAAAWAAWAEAAWAAAAEAREAAAGEGNWQNNLLTKMLNEIVK